MDNKKIEGYKNRIFGLSVESMFDHKCRELGLETKSPNARECWDRTVLSPSGELRVQIKATRTLSRQNRGKRVKKWGYVVSGKREDKAQTRFAADTVDFIAIYVAPQSRWFILPAALANCARIRISQNPEGRMRDALERWDRLTGPAMMELG
jgi:hypothetical protein